ncbi:sodium-dependent glucose transporter 1-like [Galendromus occidentalis]|uniref:Sodium-dependent glucose transporter 1-like n=1 Tax=Galendromus occidentalis TaxID=34638 RepID=A0AAJ7SHQ8_9ACAR|nr:sodium-dependent glucose transporter 1-like [Galendromus occidentalis]
MTIFFCSEASSRKSKSVEKNSAVPETIAEESRESRLKASEILLVILLAVFLLMFECNVMSFTGMITPFVIHSDLHLDKSAGAYLGGVIRSTFFAGLLLLVIAHRIPLWIVLTMSSSTLMLSSTIFAFFVLESPAMIWISAAGIGLGLSALFGTGIVWTCQYVALKHWHMAVSMLSMCIGNLAPAFLVAPWIETHPMVLAYLVLGLSALLCMTFATMLFVVRNKKKLVLE